MAKPAISTGTGDDGTTTLLMGQRVSKDSPRMHVLGALDELNAVIGVLLTEELPEDLRPGLEKLQRTLFSVGSEVVSPSGGSLSASRVPEIEEWAAGLERALPKLQRFIIPGGSKASALLHQARTICRRAERWVVTLSHEEHVDPTLIVFLNRLSDCLFLVARMANRQANVEEVEV